MKEYLLLSRGGEGPEDHESPEAWQEHMQKWMQWIGSLQEEGRLIGAQPLNETGKVVSDGPFMEGKEMVGGYLACKANSYDEAS